MPCSPNLWVLQPNPAAMCHPADLRSAKVLVAGGPDAGAQAQEVRAQATVATRLGEAQAEDLEATGEPTGLNARVAPSAVAVANAVATMAGLTVTMEPVGLNAGVGSRPLTGQTGQAGLRGQGALDGRAARQGRVATGPHAVTVTPPAASVVPPMKPGPHGVPEVHPQVGVPPRVQASRNANPPVTPVPLRGRSAATGLDTVAPAEPGRRLVAATGRLP